MRTKRNKKGPQAGPSYKSKWEGRVAEQIKNLGYEVLYEKEKFEYLIPESVHKYCPDFSKVGGWYVEAKGRFTAQDRKKHQLIKQQYPKLKLVILFQNANQRLSKKSKTTYGEWCTKNGILWQHQTLNLKIL